MILAIIGEELGVLGIGILVSLYGLIGYAGWLALGQNRPRRSALIGWCFSLGWMVAGTHWLYISMHDYGGMPAPIAAAAVVLLSAATPSRLLTAFPPGVEIRRVTLAEAVVEVRRRLGRAMQEAARAHTEAA